MTEPTTIDHKRASIYATALEIAIANIEDTLERDTNTARPYRAAMKIQLAEYQAEHSRLLTAFPALRPEAPKQAAKS